MGCIRTYLSIYLFSKERKEEKRKENWSFPLFGNWEVLSSAHTLTWVRMSSCLGLWQSGEIGTRRSQARRLFTWD